MDFPLFLLFACVPVTVLSVLAAKFPALTFWSRNFFTMVKISGSSAACRPSEKHPGHTTPTLVLIEQTLEFVFCFGFFHNTVRWHFVD